MAAVACATDFAKGFPEDQALRTCRIAGTIAEAAGSDADEVRAVIYVALLRFVGCTATASEMAAALGDELAVSAAFAAVDERRLASVLLAAWRTFDDAGSLPRQVRSTIGLLASAPAVIKEHETASCEVAALFAAEAGLPDRVRLCLPQVFERYDGRGNPGEHAGDAIDRAVRIEQVANLVELVSRSHGWPAVPAALQAQSGRRLDPALVRLVAANEGIVRVAATTPVDLDAILDSEPKPRLTYTDSELDRALAAVGAVADLKSLFTRGHSSAVAARAAAGAQGLAYPTPTSRWFAGPAGCTTSAGSQCRPRPGSARLRSARRNGRRCGCIRTSASGCSVAGPASGRTRRWSAHTTSAPTAAATTAA
jgi:hypothetical protein